MLRFGGALRTGTPHCVSLQHSSTRNYRRIKNIKREEGLPKYSHVKAEKDMKLLTKEELDAKLGSWAHTPYSVELGRKLDWTTMQSMLELAKPKSDFVQDTPEQHAAFLEKLKDPQLAHIVDLSIHDLKRKIYGRNDSFTSRLFEGIEAENNPQHKTLTLPPTEEQLDAMERLDMIHWEFDEPTEKSLKQAEYKIRPNLYDEIKVIEDNTTFYKVDLTENDLKKNIFWALATKDKDLITKLSFASKKFDELFKGPAAHRNPTTNMKKRKWAELLLNPKNLERTLPSTPLLNNDDCDARDTAFRQYFLNPTITKSEGIFDDDPVPNSFSPSEPAFDPFCEPETDSELRAHKNLMGSETLDSETSVDRLAEDLDLTPRSSSVGQKNRDSELEFSIMVDKKLREPLVEDAELKVIVQEAPVPALPRGTQTPEAHYENYEYLINDLLKKLFPAEGVLRVSPSWKESLFHDAYVQPSYERTRKFTDTMRPLAVTVPASDRNHFPEGLVIVPVAKYLRFQDKYLSPKESLLEARKVELRDFLLEQYNAAPRDDSPEAYTYFWDALHDRYLFINTQFNTIGLATFDNPLDVPVPSLRTDGVISARQGFEYSMCPPEPVTFNVVSLTADWSETVKKASFPVHCGNAESSPSRELYKSMGVLDYLENNNVPLRTDMSLYAQELRLNVDEDHPYITDVINTHYSESDPTYNRH